MSGRSWPSSSSHCIGAGLVVTLQSYRIELCGQHGSPLSSVSVTERPMMVEALILGVLFCLCRNVPSGVIIAYAVGVLDYAE